MNYNIYQADGTFLPKEIDYKEIKTLIRLSSHNYRAYCSDWVIEIVSYNDTLFIKKYGSETWCGCSYGNMCGTCEDNAEQEMNLYPFDMDYIIQTFDCAKSKEKESREKDQCCSYWIDKFKLDWEYKNHWGDNKDKMKEILNQL